MSVYKNKFQIYSTNMHVAIQLPMYIALNIFINIFSLVLGTSRKLRVDILVFNLNVMLKLCIPFIYFIQLCGDRLVIAFSEGMAWI